MTDQTSRAGRGVADQGLPGDEPVGSEVARRSGSAPSRAGEVVTQGDASSTCFHSMPVPDCASCGWGQAERCEAENRRLRALIKQHGDKAMTAALAWHDDYWRGSTVDDQ